jgi:TolB protein
MISNAVRIGFVLCLLASASTSTAELTIEVVSGVDQQTRIAIVPFDWDGSGIAPTAFDQIIANDLRLSGLFEIIAPQNMLSFPAPGDEINFRDWNILDADYLLVGSASMEEDRLIADIELYDVPSARQVLGRRITAGPNDGRDVSHRVSDLTYQQITGIPGIAESRILYVADSTNAEGEIRYRLMLADQDGAREQLVIESAAPIMSPAWSPNGEDIAYVSFETSRAAIFMQNLSTGERTQLTNFVGINGAPAFSPDGTQLAMVLSKDGNPELYVLDLESGVFTQLTDHFAIDTEPNWTADGSGLVFTSDRGGRPQIYEIDLQSGRIARLTFRGDYNARPRLSADGRFLVMVHRNEGIFHIAVQDLTDDTLIIVTETDLDESPTISPNGALVMYATKLNGNSILAAVSLDAGVKYNLPASTSESVREPAWSP